MTLARRLMGEGLGTALLLVAVVGSGIMAERLSGGNAAIAWSMWVASIAPWISTFWPFGCFTEPCVMRNHSSSSGR